jgi:hypothetical protein
MRMTVGPLPSTVYWRRRAIVLGAVLLLVVLVAWGCATAGPSAGASGGRAGSGATGVPAKGTSPSPSVSLPALLSGSPVPTGSAAAPTTPVTTGPVPACADGELTVVPAVLGGKIQSGSYPRLSLTIGSTADHDCSRDIGADQQELRVMRGAARIWSSDDCDPTHGSYRTTFHPGAHVTYDLTWAGNTSAPGCKAARTTVPPGAYQLLGRVGSKLSTAVAITIS